MNVNMYFNTYNVGYLTTVSTQKPKKNTNCYIKPQFKFAFFDRRHFLVCMQPRCDHDTPLAVLSYDTVPGLAIHSPISSELLLAY